MLDNTAVHPESYDAARSPAGALPATRWRMCRPESLPACRRRLQCAGRGKGRRRPAGIGVPTLRDIVSELMKPGRDLREELPKRRFSARTCWRSKDLKPGMVLTGTVRNVIDFGVFVDIGVHQDGLVHISQVSNRFIRHPSEVVSVGDVVNVVVLDVDAEEKAHQPLHEAGMRRRTNHSACPGWDRRCAYLVNLYRISRRPGRNPARHRDGGRPPAGGTAGRAGCPPRW